jgi:hypothetical protein
MISDVWTSGFLLTILRQEKIKGKSIHTGDLQDIKSKLMLSSSILSIHNEKLDVEEDHFELSNTSVKRVR